MSANKPPKSRLDALLVVRGLAENATKARALIMAGSVFSGEKRLDKAGQSLAADAALEVRGRAHPWVSRGGLKLVGALDHFGIDPEGATAIDIGASTGGFTDVLLARGARRVYAIDVGYGQLDQKLRNDARVVVMERVNARHVTGESIPEPLDLLVCDASFIGLRTILPAPMALAGAGAHLVGLIKPQFEVGKGRVGKGGIVREPDLHTEVCETIRDWLNAQEGWSVIGLTTSPIKGRDGNIEFLIAARRQSSE